MTVCLFARTFRRPHRPVVAALVTLACIAAPSARAQSASALTPKLDSIAGAGVVGNRAVGIAAAVTRANDTLLLKAFGKADVDANTPLATDANLAIGSITKQFTAAAILQLHYQGTLSLDDEIQRWLPDFDTKGHKLTLRHLLSHTSGVMELADMPELRAVQLMRNPNVSRDSVYGVIKRHPLRFPPGAMQVYSNTGYWLLGRVIERASRMTYEDYVEKKIFEPLGMSRSRYCTNAATLPRRAFGHGMRNGRSGRAPEIVHTGTYAAGALCSTAGDMITWLQALHSGKIISAKSYAEMIAPARLNDGTTLQYGLGTVITDDIHGHRYVGHDGGGFGYSAVARWYPDARLAVVVLTNSEPDELTDVADALVAAVRPGSQSVVPFTGDAAPLVGRYKGQGRRGEMTIEVTRTAQGISYAVDGGASTPLQWVRDWTFRRGGALLTFRRSSENDASLQLRFDTVGDHFILKRQ